METGLIVLIVVIVLLVVVLPIVVVIVIVSVGVKLSKEGACYSTDDSGYGCELQDASSCAKQHGKHFKTFDDCTAYMKNHHSSTGPSGHAWGG